MQESNIQAKPKVYLHFDVEGVLIGNQESNDTNLNQKYLDAISELKKSHNVTVDICSIADAPHVNNKLTQTAEKDVLQIIAQNRRYKELPIMLQGGNITSESEGTPFLGQLFNNNNGVTQLKTHQQYPKTSKFLENNSFGFGTDPINDARLNNDYDKAKLSLMMMLYRKKVLNEDISGSTLYFIDNDAQHINKFEDEAKEAFAELGVKVQTIGVNKYTDSLAYTQPHDAGGKGDIKEIQNDADVLNYFKNLSVAPIEAKGIQASPTQNEIPENILVTGKFSPLDTSERHNETSEVKSENDKIENNISSKYFQQSPSEITTKKEKESIVINLNKISDGTINQIGNENFFQENNSLLDTITDSNTALTVNYQDGKYKAKVPMAVSEYKKLANAVIGAEKKDKPIQREKLISAIKEKHLNTAESLNALGRDLEKYFIKRTEGISAKLKRNIFGDGKIETSKDTAKDGGKNYTMDDINKIVSKIAETKDITRYKEDDASGYTFKSKTLENIFKKHGVILNSISKTFDAKDYEEQIKNFHNARNNGYYGASNAPKANYNVEKKNGILSELSIGKYNFEGRNNRFTKLSFDSEKLGLEFQGGDGSYFGGKKNEGKLVVKTESVELVEKNNPESAISIPVSDDKKSSDIQEKSRKGLSVIQEKESNLEFSFGKKKEGLRLPSSIEEVKKAIENDVTKDRYR